MECAYSIFQEPELDTHAFQNMFEVVIFGRGKEGDFLSFSNVLYFQIASSDEYTLFLKSGFSADN